MLNGIVVKLIKKLRDWIVPRKSEALVFLK
jgi:hypothetical protein